MAEEASTSRSDVSSSSSPSSFYTANDTEDKGSTAASSPICGAPCPFEDAHRLPHELEQHCQIFLEEQLYTCAISLFNNTLTAGLSRRSRQRRVRPRSVPVPPPSHLGFLNTLLVHPVHTTRAKQAHQLLVPSLALGYLRSLVELVGPVNADLRSAFRFSPEPRRPLRFASSGQDSGSDESEGGSSGARSGRLGSKLANESSLWTRGRDLWSTVGWALNTASLHQDRWRYWRTWLEFMLDVIEVDWNERERQDQEADEANGGAEAARVTSRSESMIWMYMNQQGCSLRRIIKALLATGDGQSVASFGEVFDKEQQTGNKASRKRKRSMALDVDNGKFGDYLDDESLSSGVSEPPTPQKPHDDGSREVAYTLLESVELRLRLFCLVSTATSVLGTRADLGRLYDDFAAGIKTLPLSLFALFLGHKPNPLALDGQVTLIRELFHQLLPSRRKKPSDVDAETEATGCISATLLEHCYMDLPANTVDIEENAKLSLVVESSLQMLWQGNVLWYTDSLAEAAERGIQAREARIKKKRTGKMRADTSDTIALEILTASAHRIRVLLDVIKLCQSQA